MPSTEPAARSAVAAAVGETMEHVAVVVVVVVSAQVRAGWSQRALARAAGIGHGKISRIENTTAAPPTVTDLLALAAALQIPPAILTGWASGDGLPTSPPSRGAAVLAGLPGEAPTQRVRGPQASSPPPWIAGRLYLRGDVHRLICPARPDQPIPGYPRVRACAGCGCAVDPPRTPTPSLSS